MDRFAALINTHIVPRTSAHYRHQSHTETTWIKPTHFHKQLSVILASRGARYCQAHDLGVGNELWQMQPEERMSLIQQVNDRNILLVELVELVLIFCWDCRLTIIGYNVVTSAIATQFRLLKVIWEVWYISTPWAAGWWWCGYKYSFGMRLYIGQQCSVPARLQTLSHFNYCQLLITTHP